MAFTVDNGALTDIVVKSNTGESSAEVQVVELASVSGGVTTYIAKAEDAVAASGDLGIQALAVRADTAAATAANGDYHPLLVDSTGRLHIAVSASTRTVDSVSASLAGDKIMVGTTAYDVNSAVIDHATSGDNTIVTATAAKKIRVISCFFVCSAAVTVRFESGAGGTALTGQMQFAANGGISLPVNPYGWWADCATNTLLNMELSGATSVDGVLRYILVD